jgi:hypothetical protein
VTLLTVKTWKMTLRTVMTPLTLKACSTPQRDPNKRRFLKKRRFLNKRRTANLRKRYSTP